jgi:hypothetical protein
VDDNRDAAVGGRRSGSGEWRGALLLRNLGDGDGCARARLKALGGPRPVGLYLRRGVRCGRTDRSPACVSRGLRVSRDAVWGCQRSTAKVEINAKISLLLELRPEAGQSPVGGGCCPRNTSPPKHPPTPTHTSTTNTSISARRREAYIIDIIIDKQWQLDGAIVRR